MKETYRFLSLDSLYIKITKTVEENGVLLGKDEHRKKWLYHGCVYDWGKTEGRPYPPGSISHGHAEIRNSFPATLEIITESADRLAHLEREWEIEEDIPRLSRKQITSPKEEWDARPISEKKK
jgi:hypothetical protein